MYKTIDYCESFLDYWEEIFGFYLIPGILFVWIMASLASRNPKNQVRSDGPKVGFFKQCLWVLIAMFGGMFVMEKSLHEEFKRHRIVQKAIAVWLMVISAAIVFLDGVNPLDRNAYETVVANNTMEIYSGDTQLRAFPSYDMYRILSKIRAFFSNFALAMYIWCFRRSSTSMWFKIRKIVGICLLYGASIALAVAYTPFDLMMFGVVLLLAILLLIDYRGKEKKEKDLQKKKDFSFQIRPWTNLKNIIKKWNLAIQSGIRHLKMKRMKRNAQKEENSHIKSQQELVTSTPIDGQTDITSNREKVKSTKLRKVLRYVALVLVAIGIITGIVFGIIYLVNEYIPERKLNKAVDEIIYNFENGDKETKMKYAAWILSADHDWGYEDVSNYRICGRLEDFHKQAFAYVESMAYKGDAKNQCLLGHFYLFAYYRDDDGYESERSYYTEQDLEKSTYWYHEAAQQNNPTACNNLGTAYLDGRGTNKNMRKAVIWLKKAAELGSDYGQRNYGDLFMEGVTIKVGSHKEEYTTTEYRYYGNCKRTYYNKKGEKCFVYEKEVDDYEILVPKDLEQAKYWWKKAAAQGNEVAKDRLQKIYE